MTTLPTRIDQLQARATVDLEAAAGDLSLCAIAKSGRPMPALKYHEGRVAMLRELRRALHSGTVAAAELTAIRGRWESKRRLAEKSRDWEAYLNGGDDVIADLGLD